MSSLAAQAQEHRETQEGHRRLGVLKLWRASDVARRLDVKEHRIYRPRATRPDTSRQDG